MEIKCQTTKDAKNLCKRMVFLAWNACGKALGMGVIQEMCLMGKEASEEEVWKCAYNKEDYPMGRSNIKNENEVYCDYVFGRMMKWGCSWEGNVVKVSDHPFNIEYQGFSKVYPNNEALVRAAIDSLGIACAWWEGIVPQKPKRRIEVED